jgi:hypothetical protein
MTCAANHPSRLFFDPSTVSVRAENARLSYQPADLFFNAAATRLTQATGDA